MPLFDLRFIRDCLLGGNDVHQKYAVFFVDVRLESAGLEAHLQEAMKGSIIDSVKVSTTIIFPVIVAILFAVACGHVQISVQVLDLLPR